MIRRRRPVNRPRTVNRRRSRRSGEFMKTRKHKVGRYSSKQSYGGNIMSGQNANCGGTCGPNEYCSCPYFQACTCKPLTSRRNVARNRRDDDVGIDEL